MYTCLAAVLFVTNIEFLESSVGGLGEEQTDGVIIDDEYPLHTSKKISITTLFSLKRDFIN